MEVDTMADTERYNGWTNWATWQVALWFGNDEGFYNAAKQWQSISGIISRDGALTLAFELMPEGTPDMKSAKDFVDVNWEEVAEALNEM